MRSSGWAVVYLCQVLQDPQREPQIHSLALKSILFSGDHRALEPALTTLQSVEDPELEWGVTPQDLYLFLRRLAHSHNTEPTLQKFLENYPESPMVPALRLFLEQHQGDLNL